MIPIYDAFTMKPIMLGDELRSIERGDMVRVVEMGETWIGQPTVWLEPVNMRSAILPFRGSLLRNGEAGCYFLKMYTAAS
jgi:hypothetical protein